MTTEEITPGLVGEARVLVTEEETARHLGSGGVNVFATPAMVRLMEEAAVNALADHLPPGQQSVGVSLQVRHLAPTPPGLTATARAELIAVDGRRLTFRVAVHDDVELVGEGTHERMLIDVARFGGRVAEKARRAHRQR
jgi:predicted thioesterase